MSGVLLPLFTTIVGYLTGSICSAVIVCHLFDLPDPRIEGSKNPGATNVLRLAGKKYAIIVLFADMLKGVLPVLLAKALGADPITLSFVCLTTVLGHMYPIFFKFEGGKGVATALGALLAFHFLLGMAVVATWLLVAKLSRYSSLASITSIGLAPFFSLFSVGNVDAFLPILFLSAAIIYKHRDNIVRLIDGTETKIQFSSKLPPKPLATENVVPKKVTPAKKPIKKAKTTKKITAAEKPKTVKKKPAKTKQPQK